MSYDISYFAQAAEMCGAEGGLAQSSSLVSGMSVGEAYTALGMQQTGNLSTALHFNQAGSNAILQFPNVNDPADAVLDFEASGGLTTEANAALATSTSVGAGTVALVQGSQVPVATVGVASGGLGIAAAVCAPIFGVAAGQLLYASNPELWTRISQALLPFCYDDTEIYPIVYDVDGNTYIEKGIIDSLESLIAPSYTPATYQSSGTVTLTSTYQLSSAFFMALKNVGGSVSWSDEALEVFAEFCDTYNDRPCIIRFTNGYNVAGSSPLNIIVPYVGINNSISLGSYTVEAFFSTYATSVNYNFNVLHATISHDLTQAYIPVMTGELTDGSNYYLSSINGEGVPLYEGMEIWTGNPYPSNPNTINVLSNLSDYLNPTWKEFQQVALPIGDPLVTNDPAIQPDPYYNPSPEVNPDTGAKVYPAIDPYISPVVEPSQFPDTEEIPVPSKEERTAPLPIIEIVPNSVTENVPDPETNPATETDTTPKNPNQPGEPTSVGNSTSPYLPLVPLFPTSSAGLYHVYNPTNAQLQDFGAWLWTTFSGNLIDTLSKLFNNPMDAVISLQEFYGTPNIQSSGTIRCGYLDSGIPSDLVGNRYGVIECGTVIIPEYYGNYLDYAPYSQVIVYLPFIGFMNLNADDIIGNAVNIRYHVDSYTGSCIAIITVARQGYSAVMYQFEGNCSVDIPVTGGQQSSIKGAIIGGISGAVMGGVAGAAVGAVVGGLSTKNDVQHSGSFSATYGAMGAKKPFIVVRRPVQKIVVNYNEVYGFQAHKMVYVGNCRGYLRAKEVRILSTTATNREKELIVNALKDGVYVKN